MASTKYRNRDGTFKTEKPAVIPKCEVIFQKRCRANLTQEELAQICGVCRQKINRIERQGAHVSLKTAHKIAAAIGADFDEVFEAVQGGQKDAE